MNLEQYDNLVHRIARQVHKFSTPLFDYDDIYSAGYLGLMDAAKRFDPTKGVKFSTFASQRVRGAMIDEIRKLSRYRHGKEPPPVDYIEALRNEDGDLITELADPDLDPLGKAILKDQRLELMKIMANLSKMERQVIFMYYYKNYGMKGIAKVINRTEGRVSQIHSQAIRRMREFLSRRKIDFVN
jgi:RNA polymerase sigma factor for flagellar operon FliA